MMAYQQVVGEVALLMGRALFGGVLALMGLNHFMQTGQMAEQAAAKSIPVPTLSVLLTGVLLIFGGIGIMIGGFPLVAAVALAVFFVVTTPLMHDFWRHEGEVQRQELTHFLKNIALLGGALAFIALSHDTWNYALNISM